MASPPPRSRGPLLTTLGILVALGLVAVAARGSTPAGAPGVRRPSDTLLDLLFTLYVLSLALGLVLLAVLLVLRRYVRMASGLVPKPSPLRTLFLLLLLVPAVYFLVAQVGFRERAIELPELRVPPAEGGEGQDDLRGGAYERDFAWTPVLVLGSLVLLASVAWWRAGKARRRARTREHAPTLAEELADVLAETLDSLRAEPDARKAVIAAYARLERVAAASGLARRPAEAPLEYLGRMLDGLEVSPAAVRRLTSLFERAKFSQHEVDAAMKLEAIAALEAVQHDLHEAELRAREAREEALRRMTQRAQRRAPA